MCSTNEHEVDSPPIVDRCQLCASAGSRGADPEWAGARKSQREWPVLRVLRDTVWNCGREESISGKVNTKSTLDHPIEFSPGVLV